MESSVAASKTEATRSSRVLAAGEVYLGALTLRGVTRRIELQVTREEGAVHARTPLHQPDFGIRPFQAMFGALRIKADVDVELIVAVA